MKSILSLVFICLLCETAQAQSPFENLNVSAAVDIVAPVSDNESEENKLKVRSAEIMFFAPVDHHFDGVLNIAGHDHEGEFEFDLHEAYISSSKLIPQSRFKAGKFFLNIGRLNSFHQHDWPFVTAPKVHREFLSPGSSTLEAEGASDTGLEYSWLLPTERFIEITAGVTNGYCFGHCHSAGEKPPYPLHYIHPTTFFEWGTGKGLLLGFSYLGRKSALDVKTDLFGIDATYKQKEGKFLKWLVQSEVYFQNERDATGDKTKKIGAYVYPQYGFTQNVFLGLRLDAFSHLNLEFESTGGSRKNLDYAIVPNLTYKSSEFATFRLAYSYEVNTLKGESDTKEQMLQMQAIFILGAHPAHDF
jgi:hypothetical protein